MAAILTVAIAGIVVYLFFFVFFPLGRGAIYDPSSENETRMMADLADVRRGEKAADLGSGDGRVVIALALKGAEAHGYEINPVLVFVSRSNIRKAGLAGRAFIHWGTFWRKDLSRYALITVFQVGKTKKVLSEVNVGNAVLSSLIVANDVLYIANRSTLFAISQGGK